MEDYGMRHGGAGKKGSGWLGPMKRKDGGISTEISIGTSIKGKETEIPLMVPTLDEKEIKYLLNNDVKSKAFMKNMPDSIIKKAVEHANMRMQQNKSPFKEMDEEFE
jgi:hypothetical protein